jgi:hypothetical protein
VAKVLCNKCGAIVEGGYLIGDTEAPLIAGAHDVDSMPCSGGGSSALFVRPLYLKTFILNLWLMLDKLSRALKNQLA